MMKALPSTTFRSRALLLMGLAAFLLVTSSRAARPNPVLHVSSPAESRHGVIEAEEMGMEESCEGTAEEGECLMRRTLAAHVDYIYTQNQKN